MKGILSIQSHVVYGHAGNSSAIFPIQRMGVEAWPIHTVQFSNHTQYKEGWTGNAFTADNINELVKGLGNIEALGDVEAIITGYQGSAEQCDAVINTVKAVKGKNNKALYVCDPVMGSPEKGCIVAPGIAEKLIQNVMPVADVIVPNQFELAQFADMEITSLEDAMKACEKAMEKGPEIVLVKHLHSVSDDQFSMMLATGEGTFLAQRPHLKFNKEPVGVGDLISAVFTVGLLQGKTAVDSFSHCNSAVYGVLKETAKREEWELQTIAAQSELVNPSEIYPAQKL